jgi:hypothetical protein
MDDSQHAKGYTSMVVRSGEAHPPEKREVKIINALLLGIRDLQRADTPVTQPNLIRAVAPYATICHPPITRKEVREVWQAPLCKTLGGSTE